eukprot:m.313535 g.313535  ORF g.313535 m.313535 type:complete len:321 (-) comp34043_c0_seq1:71-1033(-)
MAAPPIPASCQLASATAHAAPSVEGMSAARPPSTASASPRLSTPLIQSTATALQYESESKNIVVAAPASRVQQLETAATLIINRAMQEGSQLCDQFLRLAAQANLEMEHDELQHKYADLKTKHADLTVMHGTLQQQHATMRATLVHWHKERQNLQDRFADYNKTVQAAYHSLRGQVTTLQAENNDLRTRNAALERELRHRAICCAQLEEKSRNSATANAALKEQHDRLVAAQAALKEQHECLTTSHAALEEKHQNLLEQHFESKYINIRTKYTALKRRHEEVEDENAELRSTLDGFEDLLHRRKQIRQECTPGTPHSLSL